MAVSDNMRGLILAVLSSLFIGTSFILKKKGLRRAGAAGTRAGAGGYTYLLEPLWWAGMTTMIVGEVANFVAYIYAPAVLVTPLGALSINVSAILAHFMLKERLQQMGVLGCVSCIAGSIIIAIYAPQEHTPSSVLEVWDLATQPAFLVYVAATLFIVLALMLHFDPLCGQTNILVYLGICSLMGALTVVSIKAVGIAIKLSLEGSSQFRYVQTWFFLLVAGSCVITQLNYLNKVVWKLVMVSVCVRFQFAPMHTRVENSRSPVMGLSSVSILTISSLLLLGAVLRWCGVDFILVTLPINPCGLWLLYNVFVRALDTFNAAIVSPIYYVMFTALTIIASTIMFKDWTSQDMNSITSEICGFILVVSGTAVLHMMKEVESPSATGSVRLCNGDMSRRSLDEAHLITLNYTDYLD